MSYYNLNANSSFRAPHIGIANAGQDLVAQEMWYPLALVENADVFSGNCIVPAPNELQMHRIAPRGIHVDKIGVNVIGTAIGSSWRFGIYSARTDNGLPDVLKYDSGNQPGTLIQAIILTVDYTYVYGDWCCFVATDGAPLSFTGTSFAVHMYNVGNTKGGIGNFNSYGAYVRGYQHNAVNPLPATISYPLPIITNWTLIGMGANQIMPQAHWDRIL